MWYYMIIFILNESTDEINTTNAISKNIINDNFSIRLTRVPKKNKKCNGVLEISFESVASKIIRVKKDPPRESNANRTPDFTGTTDKKIFSPDISMLYNCGEEIF